MVQGPTGINGFTFEGTHCDEFQMGRITKSMPYIPEKRQTRVSAQGRDGQYVFEDGYNNITIELECEIAGYNILDRRKTARQIAAWLALSGDTGSLIFDYESDMEYTVVSVTNNIASSMEGMKESFTISFECEPFQKQAFYNDDIPWDDASVAWKYAHFPWDGYQRTFEVENDDEIELVNAGTYKALPLIILSGEATTVQITFQDTGDELNVYNLESGNPIYVDCRDMVVYTIESDVKVNKMGDFSGDFLEISPGVNSVLVEGASMVDVQIEFDYKNTYL